jgi:hypothetical protein
VGRYEPPIDPDPLPPEELAEEGMLVALSAVRMSVKNRIIVSTLRDRDEWLPQLYEAAAAEDLLDLAREKDEELRLLGGEPDSREQRRAEVARELRRLLRTAAGDEDLLHSTVVQARDAAWDEIGGSIAQKLVARPENADATSYRAGRDKRLRELVTIDLEGLKRSREPEY